MVNEKVNNQMKEKFGIDILTDWVTHDVSDIVFCFDWSQKENAEIIFLRGEYQSLNLFVQPNFKIRDLFNRLEKDNPISEVYGKDRYVENIMKDLDVLDKIDELYLPIRDKNEIVWLCISLKSLTQKNNINELISGKINWVSKNTPRAILYYQNRYKDNATNLFTKTTLKLHLSRTLESDHSYGLFFDIDNFKRINDIFGHQAGDDFLEQFSSKLIGDYEDNVIYYRIGGDEFFVYIQNCTEEIAYRKALDIIYTIETLNPQGQQAEVSASVGIVPIIGNNFDFEALLDLADRTMYFSKRKGKGNISYAREV